GVVGILCVSLIDDWCGVPTDTSGRHEAPARGPNRLMLWLADRRRQLAASDGGVGRVDRVAGGGVCVVVGLGGVRVEGSGVTEQVSCVVRWAHPLGAQAHCLARLVL